MLTTDRLATLNMDEDVQQLELTDSPGGSVNNSAITTEKSQLSKMVVGIKVFTILPIKPVPGP